MRRARFPHGRILLLVLFIGSDLPLIGCDDASKTSGTMVERSAEDTAHLKSKIDAYKGGRSKDKGQATGAKK
jgi:hypothetical protein